MSRRAKGEGTLWKDARGRWVGQITVNGRKLKVVGREGERKPQVAARLKARAASPASTVVTVGDLVSDWLEKAAPKRKGAAWLDTCRRLVDSHIMPTWGRVRIDQVSVDGVESWMAELAESLSKATVSKVRSQLAQAFDYGIRRRVVDWNPAKIAELPAVERPGRDGRALTKTEVRALLNVASEHRLGAWITTSVTLGLRPGEVSGLSWPDLDLENGLVVIHRALAWIGKRPYLKETKTKRARTLELPPRTVDALTDHRKRQVEECLLMGDRWPTEWSDLVFVSERGTPINPSNLRRLITTLAREAGIEGVVTPYSLRHTATSLLSASGVAPELLADLLGHKDTRMVHHHYRHPVTPSISVARDHIEEAYG
jgi:integrase